MSDKKALGRNNISSRRQLMPIAKHSLLELVAALKIMLRRGPRVHISLEYPNPRIGDQLCRN